MTSIFVVLGAICFVTFVFVTVVQRSVRLCFLMFMVGLVSNGVSTEVTGYTIRLEYVTTPLAFALIATFSGTRGFVRRYASVWRLAFVWLVLGLACSLNAIAPSDSLSVFLQLSLSILALGVPAIAWEVADELFETGHMVVGVAALYGLVALLLFGDERVTGLAFEPNIMGSLLVSWLAVVAFFHFSGRVVQNGFHRVLTCIILVASLATVTRAVWLALFVLLGFIIVFLAARSPGVFAMSLIAMGMALWATSVIIAQHWASGTWQWRLQHLLEAEQGTGAYRLNLWESALNDIRERGPSQLFGTGLNSFSQFHVMDPTNTGPAYLSSLWLEVFYDLGAVGFVIFLLLIAAIFQRSSRKPYALPLLLVLAICATFTNVLWFGYGWAFMALVCFGGLTHRHAAPDHSAWSQPFASDGARRGSV